MSTRRAGGGWATQAEVKAKICRYCNGAVTGRRQTFCSKECVHEWRVRSDPGYARRQVEKRDHGLCAICMADTGRWERVLHRIAINARSPELSGNAPDWRPVPNPRYERDRQRWELVALLLRLFTGRTIGNSWFGIPHLWEMDHIVPVVEGGGECGLENLRTLCIPCHKRVTADLAARRADAKRPQLKLPGAA